MNREESSTSRDGLSGQEAALIAALGRLPAVKAPVDLQRRVRTALRVRALLPWWRRAAIEWPPLARSTLMLGSFLAMAGLWAFMSDALPIVNALASAVGTIGAAAQALLNAMPNWLAYAAASMVLGATAAVAIAASLMGGPFIRQEIKS